VNNNKDLQLKFYIILNLVDEEKENDNKYRLLKRFLLSKTTTASTQRTPSVLENLIRPSSTPSKMILLLE
jgi:hypothetical protein